MKDWSRHSNPEQFRYSPANGGKFSDDIAPHTLETHNRIKKHIAAKYVVVAIVSFAVGIAVFSGLDLLIRYWIGY